MRGCPATPPRVVPGGVGKDSAMASLQRVAARCWQLLGILLAAGALVWVIGRAAPVVIACLLALLGAATLLPVHTRLRDRGLAPTAAAAASVSAAIGAILAVITLVTLQVVDQVPALLDQLSQALVRLREQFPGIPIPENGNLDRLLAQAQEGAQSGVTAGLATAATVGSALALAVVLVFFLLRDGSRMWAWFLHLWPRPGRHDVDEVGRAAFATISQYVRGLTLVAFADGLLSLVALMLLGVPLASALGALTFLAAYIPVVGATVIGALAVAIAFASNGLGLALAVLAVYVAIQQLDGNVLQPWIMGQRLPLHPAAVLVTLTLGGVVAGIAGALLAVPLTAAVVAGVSRYQELEQPEVADATQEGALPGVDRDREVVGRLG